MRKISDIGEDNLIREFSRIYKLSKNTIIGIGDDAAVIKSPAGKNQLFTADMFIEGVHFLRKEAGPRRIGWKAMGAALSDIAAMAGLPRSAAVSLGLPRAIAANFVIKLAEGMQMSARLFDVDIVGGDTVFSPAGIVISVAIIAEVERNSYVLRNGAAAGDKILVTGWLGGSRIRKQYEFVPRIREARWLVKNGKINSMMDISDGLSLDLYRLINASGVGARLYEKAIPVSSDSDGIKGALTDGEDFELLFTASTAVADKIIRKSKKNKIQVSIIGEITKNKGILELIDKNGKINKLKPEGYRHF